MISRYIIYPLTMLIVIASVSCNSTRVGVSDKLPGIDLPLDEMNKKLQLYIPPESNSFTLGKHVYLVAENISNKPILLPQDYGAKIFQQYDDKWIPVDNDIQYPTGETLVLPKGQQQFGGVVIVVNPSVQNHQSMALRIVAIGTVTDENGSVSREKTGAYVDITLHP